MGLSLLTHSTRKGTIVLLAVLTKANADAIVI